MGKILSISVAAYNIEEYIYDCLGSFIFDEKIDDIEVIIVNDGSKDNTLKIALEYQNKYPNIFKVIDKKNGGWGSTVNCGISNATGKYFKLLDGDDVYVKENIIDYINFLKQCDTDMVITPYYSFDDTTNKRLESFDFKNIFQNIPCELTDIAFNYGDMPMHSCTVKTDVLKNNCINITEHCFYTDVEFMIKVCSCSKTVSYYFKEIYGYRTAREGQSVSVEGLKRHYKEHQKILYTVIDYIKNKNIDDTILHMLDYRIKEMIKVQYIIYHMLSKEKKYYLELLDFDNDICENYSQYRIMRPHYIKNRDIYIVYLLKRIVRKLFLK